MTHFRRVSYRVEIKGENINQDCIKILSLKLDREVLRYGFGSFSHMILPTLEKWCKMAGLKKQAGFTIIEVLISVSILGIVGMGFMSMMEYMRKEIQSANRKVDLIELRRVTSNYMADLTNCGCQLNLNGGTIDTTVSSPATPETTISQIQTGCAVGSTPVMISNHLVPGSSANLAVDTIKLQSIQSMGAANRYRGKFRVEFKNDSTAYPMKGFELEVRFRTDPLTPDNAKKVATCDFVGSSDGGGGGAGGGTGITGTCPEGQYVKAIQNGIVKCSAVAVGGGVSNSGGGAWSAGAPGPGCDGDYCITGDFGPCVGDYCVTNGSYCNGYYCAACGVAPACDGDYCNSSRSSRCPNAGFTPL